MRLRTSSSSGLSLTDEAFSLSRSWTARTGKSRCESSSTSTPPLPSSSSRASYLVPGRSFSRELIEKCACRTETITFDSPDHDDLATFRNPTKLRFDKHTFRDSADGASPSNDAFDRVLETAIVTDAGLDDEDDEEALLPPSSLGTSGAKASSQSREQEGNESSSSEEKGVKELVEEEDEEWLEGGGEDAGYASSARFVRALARSRRVAFKQHDVPLCLPRARQAHLVGRSRGAVRAPAVANQERRQAGRVRQVRRRVDRWFVRQGDAQELAHPDRPGLLHRQGALLKLPLSVSLASPR